MDGLLQTPNYQSVSVECHYNLVVSDETGLCIESDMMSG